MPAPLFRTTAQTGNYGERVAAAFLRRHGYRVLTRNFKVGRSEIDLVCRLGDILVFVEVKTRGDVEWIRPADTIRAEQEAALHFAAQKYLELLERRKVEWRFDVVEVHLEPDKIPVCTLIPDYFGAGEMSERSSRFTN